VSPEFLVDLGDVTLNVHELGVRDDRPSVVVMHGGPDVGHRYLLPGLEPLARRHHVVAFDFRGCGRSSRNLPDALLQPELVIDDTSHLITRLGLGQVDLLGFSTGGRAATQFVAQHPDQVHRLVLASTSAYGATDAAPHLAAWPEYQRRQALEDAADGSLRNSMIFVWNLDLAPAYRELIKELDEGDWRYERVADGTMHPWCTGDPEQILRDCDKALLILHGRQDMGFPVQLAERLHRAVPGSRLEVIDDAAHLCHFEQPELWSMIIHRFLSG
jgi:pimeloyl-ACP methyl ester carboxylesterase